MGTFSTGIDISGQKFGKLTVISEAFRRKNIYWNCLCDCGEKSIVVGSSLRGGRTTSCGCNKIEGARKSARMKLSTNPRITSARNVYQGYKDGNLTFEQFFELTQQPCHYCGNPPEKSNIYNRYKHNKSTVLVDLSSGNFHYNGLDRRDNTRPHDLDNVVACCKYCNQAKMDRSYSEFVAWVKQAAAHLEQKETDSNYLESVSELALVS